MNGDPIIDEKFHICELDENYGYIGRYILEDIKDETFYDICKPLLVKYIGYVREIDNKKVALLWVEMFKEMFFSEKGKPSYNEYSIMNSLEITVRSSLYLIPPKKGTVTLTFKRIPGDNLIPSST